MPVTGDLAKLASLARTLRTIGADTLRESMPDLAKEARDIAAALGAEWPKAQQWKVDEVRSDHFVLKGEEEAEQPSSLSRLNRFTPPTPPPKPIEQVPPPMLEAFDAVAHRSAEKKLDL